LEVADLGLLGGGWEVSSLFPDLARCVEDIAFIISMRTSHSNHYNATLGMHTGSFIVIAPHSPYAEAGVKAGHTHVATDEIGLKSVVDPVHTHDFHATILHLLGLNHERLTYFHDGRDFRLTDVPGQVVNGVLARFFGQFGLA